jgi:hypothetical protein
MPVIRIVVELGVLVGIVAAVLYLARQWDNRRRSVIGSSALVEPPADAVWRATHHGNARDQTEVQIILRGAANEVWDRRTCAVIENQDPDYDKLLFNAMEDAKSRAALLNGMRDE